MLYEIYQKMVSSISENIDFGSASSSNKKVEEATVVYGFWLGLGCERCYAPIF